VCALPGMLGVSQLGRGPIPTTRRFGEATNRFFWINRGSSDPPVISAGFAESWDRVAAWARAKFRLCAIDHFRPGTIPYHIQAAMTPDSSQVAGSRTFSKNFVFPMDAAYQNLVSFT